MNRKGRQDFQTGGGVPLGWDQYLQLLAETEEENYLGLLLPLHRKCVPCDVHYDALIKMENFNQDLRFSLIWREKENNLFCVLRIILSSRGIKNFNTKDVIFNKSKRTVDSINVEDLFRNCSLSSLTKIISKYRADFLLCGYDETLASLYNLTVKKTKEEQKE